MRIFTFFGLCTFIAACIVDTGYSVIERLRSFVVEMLRVSYDVAIRHPLNFRLIQYRNTGSLTPVYRASLITHGLSLGYQAAA
jgi:hypothetical protein